MDRFNINVKPYLVLRKVDGDMTAALMSSLELISYISFLDIYGDEDYKIYLLTSEGPVKCLYVGWMPNNPIQIIREDDKTLVLQGTYPR